MEFDKISRVPTGRLVTGLVLAALFGIGAPLATLLEGALLYPVILFSGVLLVFLWCYAGWMSGACLCLVTLVSMAVMAGVEPLWMLTLAALAPSIIVLRGIDRKEPFFAQLNRAVFTHLAGMAAAIGVAIACFGAGLIGKFMDQLRDYINNMSFFSLYGVVDELNRRMAMAGASYAQMTVKTYREYMLAGVDMMSVIYARMLPGALLAGSALTAVFSTLWGNWRMARRGMATSESFVGMSEWYLPARVSVAALGLWFAASIFSNAGADPSGAVYGTVYQLVRCAFVIQALCAIDRRLRRRDMKLTWRRVILILLGFFGLPASMTAFMQQAGMADAAVLVMGQLLLPFDMTGSLLFTAGILSALFGSRGAIRLWVQKAKDNTDDDE